MFSYREGFCLLFQVPGDLSSAEAPEFSFQPCVSPVSLLHASGPGTAFGFQPRVMGGGAGSFVRIQCSRVSSSSLILSELLLCDSAFLSSPLRSENCLHGKSGFSHCPQLSGHPAPLH